MTQIETAHEARTMLLENDADATEEAANEWAAQFFGDDTIKTGVDENGDVWVAEDTSLTNAQLVLFANWARARWN